ncbi:MAG TPA: VOC family protein [Acetobacteraceae bacterium]
MPADASWKPAGYPSVTPYLIVRGAERAIAFYQEVFGATVRLRMDAPNGRIGHAELAIGDSLIMLADEAPERNVLAPGTGGRDAVALHLYIADVDAVVRTAQAAGAVLKLPVETRFYGDRLGTIVDPFGHVWHVSTHVEDVSPEEMARRAAAMSD